MIRVLDQVVADWKYYIWYQDGTPVQQVLVHLFNGMTLIMDYDDFMLISDDEGF